jgi:hypothetical protein
MSLKVPYLYTTKKCPFCGWQFQCPIEQPHRVACRACESECEPDPADAA